MGTAITSILESETIILDKLSGKTLAVDSYNLLYQFLATIRQQDGTPLKDSKGRVTSHLTGLFFRTINLMEAGARLVFVFDGKVPKLKDAERQRRKDLKIEAQKEYEKAAAAEDVANMKKYAQRTSILTPEMVEQAKTLITYLGLPIIQAPSEGEAQAARIARNGDAYAIVSQDADSLLFGAPRVVKNLTISGKRKVAGKLAYETIQPEIISLHDNLSKLNMTQEQLIVLGILVGTDYNIGGIKGIGPKKAIALIEKHGNNFEALFEEAKWSEHFSYSWQEVFELINNMEVTDEYKIRFGTVDDEKIMDFLVKEHDFSEERVKSALARIKKIQKQSQKGLGEFF